MNANEIVRSDEAVKALHRLSELLVTPDSRVCCEAADLIESLQARLAEMRKDCDITDAANAALHGALEEAKRGEKAAVEDMKRIVDAVREAHGDETCCFACKYDCDTSVTWAGSYASECLGFDRDDCFEWRGPQEKGDKDE